MQIAAVNFNDIDQLTGQTLEERAKLVLSTLGENVNDIRRAYLKLAKKHHPDKTKGESAQFQLINEAYVFLTEKKISRTPLLTNDELIYEVTGKQVAPLLDKQKEWIQYEQWRRSHFYGNGVI
jgi:hypothetical protein